MQITRISAYQVDLPLHEGSYKWSGGNSVEVFDSTVVAVETDAGVTGYGEICPLGSAYLPAYATGARAGIAELAPQLLGLDATELSVLNRRMDQLMRGHPYVKSAIDVAWDVGYFTDRLKTRVTPEQRSLITECISAMELPLSERLPGRFPALYRIEPLPLSATLD